VFRCRVAVSLWLRFGGGDGVGLIFDRVPLPGGGRVVVVLRRRRRGRFDLRLGLRCRVAVPAPVGLAGVKIKMDSNSVCG
jgi:hypothetical protein